MKRWLSRLVLCLSTAIVGGAASAATLTWSVTGTFADGGSLSGSFVLDRPQPRPSTWNLNVAGGGSAFPALAYDSANSTVLTILFSGNTEETYRFKVNQGLRELRMTPAGPLDGSVASVPLSLVNNNARIECYNCAPFRLITGGTLVLTAATPRVTLVSIAPDPTTVAATTTATISIETVVALGPPTGTVTVLEGSTTICTITLPATSCTFAPTTLGGHTLRAQYNGDANYGTAGSNPLSFTVLPAAATTVTLVSVAPNPTTVGATTTATVTVDTIVGLGPPTGTVTVLDGSSQSLCTITLPATSCTYVPPAPGNQTVVAQYSGDASYASGTSNVLPVFVGPVVPGVTLVSVTPEPTAVGVATTATVSIPAVPPFGPPTGNVTVLDGSGNALCTITLPAASCMFTPIVPGNLSVVALYDGDANYEGAQSNTLSSTVVGITSPAPPAGAVGAAYSHTYTTNSPLPVVYTVTAGALPPGLMLAGNGVLGGTPTMGGTFAGTVTATTGSLTPTQTFSITIGAVAPGAPTIGTATPGNGQATIAFTPPASDGGSPITSYTVACGAFSATGLASPITVTGLTNGTTYACSVTATNAVGTGPASGTVSVTPVAGSANLVAVPALSRWMQLLLAMLVVIFAAWMVKRPA